MNGMTKGNADRNEGCVTDWGCFNKACKMCNNIKSTNCCQMPYTFLNKEHQNTTF